MTMTADQLLKWEKFHFPTQQEAANAVDLSIRQFRRYENGISPIPLKIELSCVSIALGFNSWEDFTKLPNVKKLVDFAKAGEQK